MLVLIQLLFLIRYQYLIGLWLGEDQRGSKNKHHEDTCLKKIGICLQISLTTPHAIVNTNWEDTCIQSRNHQPCVFDSHY